MPYFITDTSPDCDGWATIKDDGEVIGCHGSKQAAINQMIAVSIAEGMEPGGERNFDGPPAIIVDIDGTLLTFGGDPIRNVVDFVDDYKGEIIIVTARVEDDRAATVAELDAANVDWDQLFMKPTTDADSFAFKSNMVKDLLDVYNIELAIENDEDIRAEYARIGLATLTPDAVDPQELPQMLQRALPDNYRPALAPDVPEGRACGNCYFYDESNVQGDKAWCEKWDEYVDGAYYCNAWQINRDDNDEDDTEPAAYRAPAPPKDQISGSDTNKPGSASGAGGDIKLSARVETALRNKVTDHNEKMTEDDRPSWTRTTFGQLSAVYRRGAGAYSTSHRPGVTRGAWAMARVNAFLYLLRTGSPQNAAYITDNDLLPEDHPKSTRGEDRQVNLTLPAYIRAAAARGLELRAEGFGGDGLVDRTIRDARLLADGQVSEDKVIRAAAWAARHLVDLDAPQNSDADADGWPGNGAVAFYLWGINPLDPQPAIDWFNRKRDQIAAEEEAQNRLWYGSLAVRDRPGATLFHMENGVEQRRVTINEFEVRNETDGPGTFVGLASPFNSPSQPLPFIETVAPGAYARSLRSRNEIKLFVNHDTSRVLASKRAGTLRLWESERGLEVEASLPPTTDGRDMAVLLKRGDIDSMSVGFSVPKGGDSWSDDGQQRQLREVRLHEVSIVTGWPAFTETTAAIRSLDNLVDATGLEVEKLNAAITALENGEALDDELAGVLDAAVAKLRTERDDVAANLAIKQKQLDVLLARV